MSNKFRRLILATLATASLLAGGCIYQPTPSFDTGEPDVPPLEETINPPKQVEPAKTFEPGKAEAEVIKTEQSRASRDDLARQIDEIASDLASGDKARDAWIAKQGPRSEWSDEQRDFL